MGPLTTFVLEQAVAQCAEWRRDGHPCRVAVNLSTTNLLDTALPGQILERPGPPRAAAPTALVLEITESTVMADLARSKEIIQTLSDSGLLVSIDDFGTGFSSLGLSERPGRGRAQDRPHVHRPAQHRRDRRP